MQAEQFLNATFIRHLSALPESAKIHQHRFSALPPLDTRLAEAHDSR
jgi:hypothetical protein